MALFNAPRVTPNVQTEVHLTVRGRAIALLGTIAGYSPDGDRVRAAFTHHHPRLVALGIPPEDLAGLQTLRGHPQTELPEQDPQTERLFEHLSRFGRCRTPSPDLEAAEAMAHEARTPVVALDMDDETHSHLYIRTVGFRHAVKSGRLLKKVLRMEFAQDDPYELAAAWDAYLTAPKPLRAVERAREAHMAARLTDEAATARGPVLAIVPIARLEGVLASLRAPHPSPS